MQRSFQYVNGKTWSGVELLFAVTGMRKGSYRIPRLSSVAAGRPCSRTACPFAVVAGGGDGAVSSVDLRTAVRLSADAAYVGEPVIMRYYLLSSGLRAVQQINEHPDTRGFAIRQIDESPGSVSLERRPPGMSFPSPSSPRDRFLPRRGRLRHCFRRGTVPPRRRRGSSAFHFPASRPRGSPRFDTRPLAIRPLPEGGVPRVSGATSVPSPSAPSSATTRSASLTRKRSR